MNFGALAYDLLDNFASLALPPLLWLLLYLWAWEDSAEARAVGFGRRTFWLLLPAAFLASLSNVPFFGWDGSALAINLGGGAIPVFLALYLPWRWWGSSGRPAVLRGLLALGALTATLFVLVLVPGIPWFVPLAVVAGFVAGAFAISRARTESTSREQPIRRPLALASGLFGLASLALIITSYTTVATPGVGITSAFPAYLLAPLAVGVLSVFVAPAWFGLPGVSGIAFGYSATTLGVLIGADVLHQPPLYGGAASILSIGGAGLLDLVYLTGLLSVGVSFLTLRVLRRSSPGPWTGPFAAREPPRNTPRGLFREAVRQSARGNASTSLELAAASADASVAQIRRLRGLPDVPPGAPPWEGLEVAPWVSTDHLNLRALAQHRPLHAADSERGLQTSRVLLTLGHQLEGNSFGTAFERSFAFLIDLAILTVPALLVWSYLVLALPGGLDALLLGVPYNTALFAYTGVGFLYFLLNEALTGTTPGKRLWGLTVRNRNLGRPGPISLVIRNAPRLLTLTIIAELVGLVLALLIRTGTGPATVGGITLAGFTAVVVLLSAIAAVGIIGLATVAVILLNPEHGRLGDVWAGTWVLRSPRPPLPVPSVPAAVPSA